MKIDLKKLGAVPVPAGVSFDISDLYVCSDCFAVGNGSRQCTRCCSTALLGLFRFIPEHSDSTLKLIARTAVKKRQHRAS